MLVITLLFSFFITLSASEDGVTSVGGFLQMIGEHLKGNHGYRPIALPVDSYEKDTIVAYLPDGNGGRRLQLVNDPDHILMKSYDEFDPPQEKTVRNISMYRLTGGTREVAACGVDGKKRFCFKLCPEAPGVEAAVRAIYKAFMPSESDQDVPLPKSVVIMMNDRVFLVSEFIEGMPLREFLEKRQKREDYVLDVASFQRLVIFCMMINPEDCRLENCLVRKKPNGLYEIVLIDNERSLGKEFVDAKVKTRVHCVLFCFYDLLLQSVNVNLLHAIEDRDQARGRLLRLEEEHLYQLALREQLRKEDEKKIILGIPLGQDFIISLNKKWDVITKRIHEGKNLKVIFDEVMPAQLTEPYMKDPIHDDVLTQIKKVDRGRNEEDASAPPSSYVDLQHYFYFNSQHRNLAIFLAQVPSLSFEQLTNILKQVMKDAGHNDEVKLFDYFFYDSKNTHDDLSLSLIRILPYSPRVMPEEELKYHDEDAAIAAFLKDNEE